MLRINRFNLNSLKNSEIFLWAKNVIASLKEIHCCEEEFFAFQSTFNLFTELYNNSHYKRKKNLIKKVTSDYVLSVNAFRSFLVALKMHPSETIRDTIEEIDNIHLSYCNIIRLKNKDVYKYAKLYAPCTSEIAQKVNIDKIPLLRDYYDRLQDSQNKIININEDTEDENKPLSASVIRHRIIDDWKRLRQKLNAMIESGEHSELEDFAVQFNSGAFYPC